MSKWNYKNLKRKDLPKGATIPEGGTSVDYKTGGWRTKHPVIDEEKCIHCLFCYMFCPDSSVIVKDGKVVGIDLDHCKGCGICSFECPKDAITMEDE